MYYKVKTSKDKSTEIFPPVLLKATDIAMLRAQKGQQKVPNLKKTAGLCPFRNYYSMDRNYSLICRKYKGAVNWV